MIVKTQNLATKEITVHNVIFEQYEYKGYLITIFDRYYSKQLSGIAVPIRLSKIITDHNYHFYEDELIYDKKRLKKTECIFSVDPEWDGIELKYYKFGDRSETLNCLIHDICSKEHHNKYGGYNNYHDRLEDKKFILEEKKKLIKIKRKNK